jgi:hypothetical protein
MGLAGIVTIDKHGRTGFKAQPKQRLLPISRRTPPTLAHSAKAILSLGTPPLTSPTVNQGPADPPIATNQRPNNVAQAHPAFQM